MACRVTADEHAVRLCARSTGPPLAAGTSAALQVLFSGNTDFLPSSLPFPGYSLVITVRTNLQLPHGTAHTSIDHAPDSRTGVSEKRTDAIQCACHDA